MTASIQCKVKDKLGLGVLGVYCTISVSKYYNINLFSKKSKIGNRVKPNFSFCSNAKQAPGDALNLPLSV